MPTNEFSPFATGMGANVEDPATWAADAIRTLGIQTGRLSSQKLNTALRQSSEMSSMLGEFIADYSGSSALDNGDIATLEASFSAALKGLLSTNIWHYGASDTGAMDAMVFTVTPTISSYATPTCLIVRPAFSNTGATPVTINVNGLGVKQVVNVDGSQLQYQQIIAGGVTLLFYDGTKFQLIASYFPYKLSNTRLGYPGGNIVPPGFMGIFGNGYWQVMSQIGGDTAKNWTVPAGIRALRVRVIGSGGQNGGSGGGYAHGVFNVSPGQVISRTLGSGSGTTSFGALLSATGGADAGGTPGAGTGGDFQATGGVGKSGDGGGAAGSQLGDGGNGYYGGGGVGLGNVYDSGYGGGSAFGPISFLYAELTTWGGLDCAGNVAKPGNSAGSDGNVNPINATIRFPFDGFTGGGGSGWGGSGAVNGGNGGPGAGGGGAYGSSTGYGGNGGWGGGGGGSVTSGKGGAGGIGGGSGTGTAPNSGSSMIIVEF